MEILSVYGDPWVERDGVRIIVKPREGELGWGKLPPRRMERFFLFCPDLRNLANGLGFFV